jgi:Zn-dependent peptidase ImmA (M78 family)
MICNTNIIEYARSILHKYSVTSAPTDVEKISKAEGILIARTDLTGLEKDANRKISGLIYVDKAKNDRQILVNNTDIETRQTFTIAHELGHFFLHIDDDDDGVIVSFRGLKNHREREADLFASELLMPERLVRKEYSKLPFPTASYLANIFQVSGAAMRFRLDELGLRYIG